MIRIKDFRRIEIEVNNAIRKAFEYARKSEKDKNDYYLFLCNATYMEQNKNTNATPYVIEYGVDAMIDEHRLLFLTKYLQSQYSFSQFNTSDSKETLTMGMMMYTHIWESKTFLKQLKKLNDLCMGLEYDWDTRIPEAGDDESKQSFIRNIIRDNFKNIGLDIATVITNGYRSQFRNAFAHSDYSFGLNEVSIDLHNYKPNSYEVKSVKIDEWTIFFCYSFLLNYRFQSYYYEERQKISSDVEVFLRNENGEKKKGMIKYHKERNGFSGRFIEQ